MRMLVLITLIAFVSSCNRNAKSADQEWRSAVKDSVQQMTASIAKDVSNKGPRAWLQYFKDTSDFFMASGGQLVFANNDSAKNFINHVLVKSIREIKLHWSNVRVDPLTNTLASVGSAFHEDMMDSTGKELPIDGYFTGTAEQTSSGWKLLNAHWSMAAAR